jgi:hypothetical protein
MMAKIRIDNARLLKNEEDLGKKKKTGFGGNAGPNIPVIAVFLLQLRAARFN